MRAARSTQGGESLGDVGKAGIVATNALEQIACLRQVAGALVQVAERVPGPDMVVLHAMLLGASPVERGDRLGQPTLVGTRAGEDDTSLGHERARRRGGGELVPQLLHPAVPAEG